MSAITADWAPLESESPVTPHVEGGKVYRREEEFRSALNNYIAGYVAAQQERRAVRKRALPRPRGFALTWAAAQRLGIAAASRDS
jgi:hypothetical protein